MSNVGRVGWIDLTVKDASGVASFYEQVVGWKIAPVEMGEYQDFCLNIPADDTAIAGICHALGENSKLPPQWLVYVNVENVAQSIAQVHELGGRVIDGPRKLGGRDFACIQDPAGAYLGLLQVDGE